MRQFTGVTAFAEAVGEELGHTSWLTLSEDRIAAFHMATGSAKSLRPDGHEPGFVPEYLVIAAVSPLLKGLYDVANVAVRINYGVNLVKFHSRVRVGSRIRARAQLASAEQATAGYRVAVRLDIECDGHLEDVGSAEVVMMFVAQNRMSGESG
ncbi:hypothetical protein [Aeromicrobium duanguangcaii]|uniref:MaoC family dehydratase n=1 Tax=Aeromicrobium duanguangcaii TaxID=2968086 RepID=A0ABY5KHH9_9ACTN|nr:hypothetical protein [Aeromicrobium duanguangcaii]MCD9153135.1 hypothetical protein [Aeromicrobium duanguangcaii]UUI69764.1 hypothetical protein NP095_06635 [Aeromicrobium duanguangcaii]